MAEIKLVGLNKAFSSASKITNPIKRLWGGSKSAETERNSFSIKDINLTVLDGKTVVVLGPSGSGKTQLLRLIAGIQNPDSGQVVYDGVDVTEMVTGDRQIGMVFQRYALYPHFSNKDNILSYFQFRKKTEEMKQLAEELYQRTAELMGVDITHLIGRMPKHLSGGERQRVAIGRCITRNPDVFLLDEPFSNLDQKLRDKYRVNLKRLLKHFKITTVYVTHDQLEAMLFADIVAVMRDGEIVQTGTYREIYETPCNLFVADFLNLDYETPALNALPGEMIGAEYAGKVVGIRPEEVEVLTGEASGDLVGKIINITLMPMKQHVILTLDVQGHEMTVYIEHGDYEEGQEVSLTLKHMLVFDGDTEELVKRFS